MEVFTLKMFTLLFGLTEIVGAMLMILLTVWLISFRGGFAWTSSPKLQFNWHPFLMTVGMIYMYGNAALIYRAFRNTRKRKLKIAHAIATAITFLLTVVGLQAVFDSHNLASPPIPNMYSLHSWLGIGTLILYSYQWISGLIVFLVPSMSARIRGNYYPFHVSIGVGAFVCAAATSLLGLTEKAIFSVPDYSQLVLEGILMNLIGIVIFMYTCLVIHLVTVTEYKRLPLPEDEMLLTSDEWRRSVTGGKENPTAQGAV